MTRPKLTGGTFSWLYMQAIQILDLCKIQGGAHAGGIAATTHVLAAYTTTQVINAVLGPGLYSPNIHIVNLE